MSTKKNVNQETKKRATIPPATEIEVAPTDYEPSKGELDEEVPMPNLTLEEAKERFMRPFRPVSTKPDGSSGLMVEMP